MKKYISIIVLAFIMTEMLYAQQFAVTIGESGIDVGQSIIQTTDGGYAITGYSLGVGQVIVTKLDNSGLLQWSDTIGGFGGTGSDMGMCIIQTSDGGYAIGGIAGTNWSDFYFVKLDITGALQWTRTIGGFYDPITGLGTDCSYSIIQTSDGGYAMTGFTDSWGAWGPNDVYVVKLDNAGALQWTRTIGGTGNDGAFSIIQTTDGGYALTGFTKSYGLGIPNTDNMYVIKLDNTGAIQWTRVVGGNGFTDDRGETIRQTSDGGYIIGGWTQSYGAGGLDVYVVKLDNSGTLQWTKTIGGTNHDMGKSLAICSDGGYIITGYTTSYGAGGYDVYIVKLDNIGTLQWTKTIGGAGGDDGSSIIQTTDGGYAIAGHSSSYSGGDLDIFIIKLDASGNTCLTTGSGGIEGSGGISNSGGSITSSNEGIVASWGTIGSYGILSNLCNAPPEADFIASDTIICVGSCIDFTDLSINSPTSWSWTFTGGSPGTSTSQNPANICYSSPGTYTVTLEVGNAYGSDTEIDTSYITVLPNPVISISPSTPTICSGSSVSLTANGGVSYTWSPSTGLSCTNCPNPVANPASTTTYTVTGTDINGCADTNILIVNVNPEILSVLSGVNPTCNNLYNGYISHVVSGGVPPYSFLWSNNAVTQNLDNLHSGLYQVTVTDNNGCTSTNGISLSQPSLLYVSTNLNQTICNGQSASLSASASGGTGPNYSYLWSNMNTSSSITVSPQPPQTTYYVTTTDMNGCMATTSVTLYVSLPTQVTLISNTDSVCPGDPVMLTPVITGGVCPPYTIVNQNGMVVTPPIFVYPEHSGYYSVYVEDACGTYDTGLVYIYTYPLPPVSVQADTLVGCDPLTVHFNELSPDSGNTYLWDFGDNENLSLAHYPVHTYTIPGTVNRQHKVHQ